MPVYQPRPPSCPAFGLHGHRTEAVMTSARCILDRKPAPRSACLKRGGFLVLLLGFAVVLCTPLRVIASWFSSSRHKASHARQEPATFGGMSYGQLAALAAASPPPQEWYD